MANKNPRQRERKKPKKGVEKRLLATPLVPAPPVEVVAKGKAAKEPKE
jgi:hypothetical protein